MALQGQVAMVLGGAGGIGLATAEALLRAGANVAVCDVSSEAGSKTVEKLQAEFGAERCFFVQADVCDDALSEAAFTTTKNHFNKLDILINSAGILNDHDWNLEVDINLKGVIRGTLLAWKHMGKHEGGNGGTVVNVASILGISYAGSVPIYTATKHAIVGFGRSCGVPFHVERTGVRVMTVCPGGTRTALITPTGKPQHLAPDIAKEYRRELAGSPMQTADHVGRAILHLIQHGSSGSVWVCEGGEEAYEVAIPERQDMRVAR